jgi:hypothetical protein
MIPLLVKLFVIVWIVAALLRGLAAGAIVAKPLASLIVMLLIVAGCCYVYQAWMRFWRGW